MHLRKNGVQLLKVCFNECATAYLLPVKNFSNWAWLSRSSIVPYRLAFTSFSTPLQPPPPPPPSSSSPATKLENYSFWDGKCDQVHFENWIQLHCTIIDALRFDYIIDSFIFEFLRLKFLFYTILFFRFPLIFYFEKFAWVLCGSASFPLAIGLNAVLIYTGLKD